MTSEKEKLSVQKADTTLVEAAIDGDADSFTELCSRYYPAMVAIVCDKLALNGLVKLYTQTGDDSKVQVVREQLSEIEKEVQGIKRTAKEAEAKR